LFRSKEKLIEK